MNKMPDAGTAAGLKEISGAFNVHPVKFLPRPPVSNPPRTVEYNIVSPCRAGKRVLVLHVSNDARNRQPASAAHLLVSRTSAVTASPRAASARTRVLPEKTRSLR